MKTQSHRSKGGAAFLFNTQKTLILIDLFGYMLHNPLHHTLIPLTIAEHYNRL
jgi:hypothetical protein